MSIPIWTTWGLPDRFIKLGQTNAFSYRGFQITPQDYYNQDDVNYFLEMICNLYDRNCRNKEQKFKEYLEYFVQNSSVLIEDPGKIAELNRIHQTPSGDLALYHEIIEIVMRLHDEINSIFSRRNADLHLGKIDDLITICNNDTIPIINKLGCLIVHFFYYIFRDDFISQENPYNLTGGQPF